MTYYLKYRPQTLADLDQANVRKSLESIVSKDSIPHAFLFSGPKGTGKTSAARILAKIVNCENPQKGNEPCNKCEECISIAKGGNLDVIELDAASHRGIEDIRIIRDAVKLAPAKAKKKVYIIDEAHMLTTEASNALLKTLEEPPSHVMFILATTNPEKLIDTIRSRSTNIVFKKAGTSEIVSSLEKIGKGENINYEKDALVLIAMSSDGSFRDAAKILEQIVMESGDLTKKGVQEYFSIQKIFNLDKFLEALSRKDTAGAVELIKFSVDNGASSKEMIGKTLDRLRSALISKIGLEGEDLKDFNKFQLISLIKLFSEALSKSAFSLIEQMPLEIAVIEWCEKGNDNDKKDHKKGTQTSSEPDKEIVQKATSQNGHKPGTSEKSSNGGNGGSHKSEKEISDEIWSKILSVLRPGHASTEALLRAARPLEFDGVTLKLGVYYKFHKEHLEGAPHRDVLEEALSSILGNHVRVTCMLTSPPDKPNGNVILTEPQPDTPSQALDGSDSALTSSVDNDIIKIAEKIFGN